MPLMFGAIAIAIMALLIAVYTMNRLTKLAEQITTLTNNVEIQRQTLARHNTIFRTLIANRKEQHSQR